MNQKIMKALIIIVAVLYVIWPIDLIPDIIPIIGWIDDIVVIAGTLWFILKR